MAISPTGPSSPSIRPRFSASILAGRAAGTGPGLSEPVVRGAMLLRLTGFLSGHAGVTPGLCRFIAERLNDGWYPVVPAAVSGAAGEIVPLAHLFGTFVGEGSYASTGGRSAPAMRWPGAGSRRTNSAPRRGSR